MARDTTLLRKQVWESMFRARFSSVYYQLCVNSMRRWEKVGQIAIVVVVIVGVSVASSDPSQWIQIAGTAVIPMIISLTGIVFSHSRRKDAEHCYERWSDLLHDFKSLWEYVNGQSPAWNHVTEEVTLLRERERSLEARDPQSPSSMRLYRAEHIVYEELGLEYS